MHVAEFNFLTNEQLQEAAKSNSNNKLNCSYFVNTKHYVGHDYIFED